MLGAYRWLSDNYEDDDCIFLFGVSSQDYPDIYYVRILTHARFFSWSISSSSALGDDRKGATRLVFANSASTEVSRKIQVGLIFKGNEMQIPLCDSKSAPSSCIY